MEKLLAVKPLRLLTLGACALVGASACTTLSSNVFGIPAQAAITTPAGPVEARAELINRDREVIGMARFQQGPNGVVITIKAEGLASEGSGQWHGAHLHEIGDCSNEDFTSSGGHINPDGATHGFLSETGPDNADLPNLWVHPDGVLKASAFNTRVAISEGYGQPALLDENGSALVIHANPDDMISQPIGGAGPRIICGVIEAVDS